MAEYAPRIGESVRVKASLNVDGILSGIRSAVKKFQETRAIGVVQSRNTGEGSTSYCVQFPDRKVRELFGDELEPVETADELRAENAMLRVLLRSAVYNRVVVSEGGEYEAELVDGQLVTRRRVATHSSADNNDCKVEGCDV